MDKAHMKETGLILINTGEGKGKSTAAFGTVLRSLGRGYKVLILQFIKSGNNYGELEAFKNFNNLDVRSMGKGFVFHNKKDGQGDLALHKAAAEEAWCMVEEEVASDKWDLILLDEIIYAIDYGLVPVEKVTNLLDTKPERLNVILTGRNAPPELIDRAHTVTEMKMIKHAYKQGIKARKGIEF